MAIGVSAVALSAQADVVVLANGRTLDAVSAVAENGHVNIVLRDGATLTMPAASVERIEADSTLASLCSTSVYACQNRGMLLSRTARAQRAAQNLRNQKPPARQP